MANVMIPDTLWTDIVDYFHNDNLDVHDRIKTQINIKLDKQIRHEQYTEKLMKQKAVKP